MTGMAMILLTVCALALAGQAVKMRSDNPKPALANRVWGTNIHFTDARPGEMEALSTAFRVNRMDFSWADIEKIRGQYNFSDYDRLLSQQQANNVQAYWILDYGNPIWTGNDAPQNQSTRDAFARFAIASMEHFKGNNIIWELWNEPNIPHAPGRSSPHRLQGWAPYANVTQYIALLQTVGSALEQHSDLDNEAFVAPAAAGLDPGFIQACFEAGTIKYLDGISVHAYRSAMPETVVDDFANLRQLIANYTPSGSKSPVIISGEWGYSTCISAKTGYAATCNGGAFTGNNTYTDQAKFLVREWLINAMLHIPVSIFYDFLDDCTDAMSGECNFGTVENAYNNASLPHVPKPSFNAAATLQKYFASAGYPQRIAGFSPGSSTADTAAYVLQFGQSTDASDNGYAVWRTNSSQPGTCHVRERSDCGYRGISKDECLARACCFEDPYVGPGPQCYFKEASNTTEAVTFHGAMASACFDVFDMLGAQSDQTCADTSGSVTIVASDEPRYLVPK